MGTMKTQKTHKKSLLDMLCAISIIQKYQIQINIWSGIQLRSRIVYSKKVFHIQIQMIGEKFLRECLKWIAK